MPHAVNAPNPGFQALILCGPGASLNTFTSKPEEFPKALLPVGNRPMVWYPLDWCYRMGIVSIHLITPAVSAKALEAALLQNPHLTSQAIPRADVVAPTELTYTTGTAELLRLPEVRAIVKGDFVVLPCDLVCELPGDRLLELWMLEHHSVEKFTSLDATTLPGGLGVWYDTKGAGHEKEVDSDFVLTSSIIQTLAPATSNLRRSNLSQLLYAAPTDTLHDVLEKQEGFPLRTALLNKHGNIRILTAHRDAHVFFFPHWVLDFAQSNETFDSISEDIVGWWAKSSWQEGLSEKLHLDTVLNGHTRRTSMHTRSQSQSANQRPSFRDLTSIATSRLTNTAANEENSKVVVPSMLAYVHPKTAPTMIQRVDTAELLLSTSVRLAAIPAVLETKGTANEYQAPAYFAHSQKILTDASLIAAHTTIDAATTLIAPNTSIATHCTIRSSCIGANCIIGEGVRMTGSVLMDNVQVDAKVQLQNCILGRRCFIGRGARLDGCEVQEGFRIEVDTVGKPGEKFSVFEGLERGLEGMADSEQRREECEANELDNRP